jgi:transcriptional regulator with XRE-family HTH domain
LSDDIAVTPEVYRDLRQSVGSQTYVAGKLGIHPQTVSNRERGLYAVTREALMALWYVRHVEEEGVVDGATT